MLDTIITIFAIVGLAFLLKESDGPWGIVAWSRNLVMRNRFVGVFFYKLLDCYFCLGFHCGWLVYLLHDDRQDWSIQFFILWGLAGGALSLIFDMLLSKLSASE
jgi:hypothetical protein